MRLRISNNTAALADQAVVSAISLLTGMLLMRFTEKSDYGIYVLFLNATLLLQSMQNAILTSPLMTVVPRRGSSEFETLARMASEIQWGTVLVLTGAAALSYQLAAHLRLAAEIGATYQVAGLLFAVGALAREFSRTLCYLRKSPVEALRTDTLIGFGVVIGLVAGVIVDEVDGKFVLALVGTMTLVVATFGRGRAVGETTTSKLTRAGLWGELWECGKWALPNVIVAWVYSSAYTFVVAAIAGPERVAELGAARMVLMPLGLIVTAWSNAFRPQIADAFKEGRYGEIEARARRIIWVFAIASALYALCAWVFFPTLNVLVLHGKFAGIESQFPLWGAYFFVSFVRTCGMVGMLSLPLGYRLMFRYGWSACAIVVPLAWLSALRDSNEGLVTALVLGELALSALVWMHGWPRVRDEARAVK